MKRRLVVKIGTRVLTLEDGALAMDRLRGLLIGVSHARSLGWDVLIVTSGAVGLGRKELSMTGTLELSEKQACAAIGQGLLIQHYRQICQNFEPPCQVAQILLTSEDLSNQRNTINLRQMLEELCGHGVLPVINENDSTSITEIREIKGTTSFGDNDQLSALVAAKLNCSLLILLTDVDGVYLENPKINPKAQRLTVFQEGERSCEKLLRQANLSGTSELGRGGMASKVRAARTATRQGVSVLIASGFEDQIIERLITRYEASDQKNSKSRLRSDPGTLFIARKTRVVHKKVKAGKRQKRRGTSQRSRRHGKQ